MVQLPMFSILYNYILFYVGASFLTTFLKIFISVVSICCRVLVASFLASAAYVIIECIVPL